MKKLLFLIGFLLFAGSVYAEPYLGVLPYTDSGSKPDEFIIEIDESGVTTVMPYSEMTDRDGNLWAVVYDLVGLSPGWHKVSIRARNDAGISGALIQGFFLPAIPPTPAGMDVFWK